MGIIVYDDACHFLKFASKPEKRGVDPKDDLFANKKFVVDAFHYRSRTIYFLLFQNPSVPIFTNFLSLNYFRLERYATATATGHNGLSKNKFLILHGLQRPP